MRIRSAQTRGSPLRKEVPEGAEECVLNRHVAELYSQIRNCQAFGMQSLQERVSQFLSKEGIRLNTDLGQHFLVDEEALMGIVEIAGIESTDHIIEIGPGIGILTAELLQRARHVTAIELDQRLIPLLKSFIKKSEVTNQRSNPPDPTAGRASELTILQGNALTIPLPEENYKMVANIPYHITSPLLRHAFLESRPPRSLTLLIQREVAEKICDTKSRSMLSILVQLFGTPSLTFIVPPSSFLPPPKVDSAVLHIESFEKPRADRETIDRIFTLTKLAFGQKRKMLRNSIGSLPNGMEMLAATNIDPTRRPETLSIEEWITLAKIQR